MDGRLLTAVALASVVAASSVRGSRSDSLDPPPLVVPPLRVGLPRPMRSDGRFAPCSGGSRGVVRSGRVDRGLQLLSRFGTCIEFDAEKPPRSGSVLSTYRVEDLPQAVQITEISVERLALGDAVYFVKIAGGAVWVHESRIQNIWDKDRKKWILNSSFRGSLGVTRRGRVVPVTPVVLALPSRCRWCGLKVVDGRVESGAINEQGESEVDWMTEAGDFGCDRSPETSEDGVGSHEAPERYPGGSRSFVDEGFVNGHWGSEGSGLWITDGTRMLLLQRSAEVQKPGTWAFPGGAVPVNRKTGRPRSPRASAIAEAKEELRRLPTGIRVSREPVAIYRARDGSSFRYATFRGQVVPQAANRYRPTLNEEHDAWGWFDREEALDLLLHPGVRWFLETRVRL